jgi:hypothetical protein
MTSRTPLLSPVRGEPNFGRGIDLMKACRHEFAVTGPHPVRGKAISRALHWLGRLLPEPKPTTEPQENH